MNIDKLTLEEKIGHNRKLNDISAETKNKKEKIGLYIPKKIISLSKYNKYNKIPVKCDFSKNTSYKKRNENNIDKNNIIRYDSRGNKFYLSEIRNYRKLDNAFFSDYVILQGKYLVIIEEWDILIYNILNAKLIEKYFIKTDQGFFSDRNRKDHFNNLIKWENSNDNMFLLIHKEKKRRK